MNTRKPIRWLAVVLAIVLTLGMLPPAVMAASLDYRTFLADLKVLEGYAESYAAANPSEDAKLLVINYVRTGVEKYTTSTWTTMAGAEKTAFTEYVAQQDAANGTTASSLRDLNAFTTPNGQTVEFEHMFGAMNMAYVNSKNADLGSWAGDLCDLIGYTKGKLTATELEAMVTEIREDYLGIDDETASSFGILDIYGDLDAYYLVTQLKAGGVLSTVMENYYTVSLSDSDRAAFFLNNRFGGLETQDDVRTVIYSTYTSDLGVSVLESDNGITNSDATLRTACCYAFADYLFDLAGDRLEGDTGSEDDTTQKESFKVFSTTESILAPGITQSVNYALTGDKEQFAYYFATVDITRDDVSIFANYKDNDPSAGWGMQRVSDQMIAAQNKHSNPADPDNYIENYTSVVGINADFYNMSNGCPSGALVMSGVQYHGVGNENFFAILKDGTPIIGKKSEWNTYQDQIQEAVGGSIILLKDGEYVEPSGTYYTERGTRSVVGITADGKIIMLVVDGRQAPFSVGATCEEVAQILLDAGCVDALHLDGGGSATYVAKPEGSDSVSVISRPSDGYERSVSSSLVAVSTAKISNEFAYATISSEYDYLTVGTSLTMTAIGVSESGNSAPVPENAVWQISDSTIGTIENGLFTAIANGEVEVQLVVDGTVVGSKTLHVVIPDTLQFEKDVMNAVYGVPTQLPLLATYNGNPVALNEGDVLSGLDNENAATVEGFTFTAVEGSGIRRVMVGMMLMWNDTVFDFMYVDLYEPGEAYFDFDNATAGNRTLAWLREVLNGSTNDNYLYSVVTPGKEMSLEYTFALDMSEIEVPEKLAGLTYMLPGADTTNGTAWGFLLQLAERVSELTEVRVTAQFDADLDVDYSELKVSNEYFTLKEVTLDENNRMTIICGWIDQTTAIDPATANPICILSGIKATPKDDAAWDVQDQLLISNAGDVSYNIFLRANALYNFACDPEKNQGYDLIPFINPNDPTEKGASFGAQYATFEDTFVLDSSVLQGWQEIDKELYYFVDHVPVTGIQKLPGYEDASTELFYQFDENGVCQGPINGLLEWNGDLYHAIQGQMLTGWRAVFNDQGGSDYYFFDYTTGKAVDGVKKIDGYTYTFTDHILTRGQIVETDGGYRYMWAGTHVIGKWVEVDGNTYYATFPKGYFATGMIYARTPDETATHRYLFSETGVLRNDLSGLYHEGADTYLVEEGIVLDEPGLVLIDGYYYYFGSDGKAVKGRTYWPTKTNGLLPLAAYYFDEQGRMTNPPATEPEDPDAPVKNGIVSENGKLYYYVDGTIRYGAGLIQLDGDYYYVRSNGTVAVGNYWVTVSNGLLPCGMYNFGTDGKMLNPPVTEEPETPTDPEVPTDPETPTEPETPAVKNGIVAENGGLYYYENGFLRYCAGLIQLDGDYYYVRSNAQLAVGQYWVTTNNGLLPSGMYTFGTDGKMLNPPVTEEPEEPTDPEVPTDPEEPTDPEVPTDPEEPTEPEVPTEPETPAVKNGFITENGGIFYYVDGKIQYCAGLILVGGDYYYVRSNGQLAVGQYWVTTNNGLLPSGMYTFDTDGKMIR